MLRPMLASNRIRTDVLTGRQLQSWMPELRDWAMQEGTHALSRRPEWLTILAEGLYQTPYAIVVSLKQQLFGFLPLMFVESSLFGRFLVSMPYLNSNGVIAQTPEVQTTLIDRAVLLADELDVKHLELRHEAPLAHPALTGLMNTKVHMRLHLPDTIEQLWKSYDAKVRNQIRKGEKQQFSLRWGGVNLLPDFYEVMSQNMRDLGTPIYPQALFYTILATFPEAAELCLAYDGSRPIAGAMLLHGQGVTEVPSASSLREYNPSCVNMLVYSKLLERSVLRSQTIFDFGRSTTDGPTFKFKKQWGAQPHPTAWQFHYRHGQAGEMRPDHPKYRLMIQIWQRLPIRLTQLLGPGIVRGIP